MAKKKRPRLSDSQLELMNIIWEKGEATVTEVWQGLPPERRIARTTVMTVLHRLSEKGWLRRRKVGNEHVYAPSVSQKEALGGMLDRLLDTAFGGSAERLVLTLVNSRGISRDEAEHLRRIIEKSTGSKTGDEK